METTFEMSGREVTTVEFEAIMAQESIMRIISSITVPIFGLVIFLILALYFFLAASVVAEEKHSYGQMLTLISWASLPALLSYLSMALSYATANDYIFLASLDKTSVASLLQTPLNSDLFALYSSLTVASIWSFILYAIGFARITRSSLVTASIVGAIPAAIQYGLAYFL